MLFGIINIFFPVIKILCFEGWIQ